MHKGAAIKGRNCALFCQQASKNMERNDRSYRILQLRMADASLTTVEMSRTVIIEKYRPNREYCTISLIREEPG